MNDSCTWFGGGKWIEEGTPQVTKSPTMTTAGFKGNFENIFALLILNFNKNLKKSWTITRLPYISSVVGRGKETFLQFSVPVSHSAKEDSTIIWELDYCAGHTASEKEEIWDGE